MTIEEKAKAYDEALEKARKKYQEIPVDYLEFIFPQLAESEDERIIKKLQEYVKNRNWNLNGPTQDEALAWLEKQKESLHISETCKENADSFTDDDERIRNAIIGLIEELQISEKYFAGVELTDMLAWLEKQKDASKATEAVERIDKYIDEHLANAHDMKDSNPDKKYYRGWDDALAEMSRILQDVYSTEKQKKPHYTKRNALFDKCVENCDPEVMKEVSDNIDKILEPKIAFGDWGDKEKQESIFNCLKYMRFVKKITNQEYDDLTKWLNDNLVSNVLEKDGWTIANEQTDTIKEDYYGAFLRGEMRGYLRGTKQKELPFVKDVILGYPGLYFYDGERMHFRGSLAMEEKQKEQKPVYNLEIPAGDVAPAEEDGPFDEDEFLEDELSAFLQNYDKEYDDDAAVSDVARHFYEIGKKQKEQKEIPLMNGDSDAYFDEWNLQQQNPTKRQCFEEGMRYAQRLQKEHRPVSYSPLCNTIKDKIREYVANNFVTDTIVKTDVKSIVKAMEEGVRLGKEEQKPIDYDAELEKCKHNYLYFWDKYVTVKLKSKKWSDEDSDNLERVDNYLWMLDNYVGDDCAMPQGKTDKIRENIQKVLSPWLKSLPERFNLQPNNEWSEEDKRMLSRCIKSVECSKQFADSETYKTAKDAEINWLKFIFSNLKKKNEDVEKLCSNEWSEEDKKTIDDAYCWLCEYAGSLIQRNYGKSSMLYGIANKLKSLHPQYNGDVTMTEAYKMGKEAGEASHWKPSKEQIEAFKNSVEHIPNAYYDDMWELYEQLKKRI